MKFLSLILSISLLINSAIARDKKKNDSKRGEWLKKELNLSEEQVKKMSEARQSNKESQDKLEAQVQELRNAYEAAKTNENTSDQELTSRFEALQKARSDLQRERFNKMIEMRSTLTPEQRKKFKEMRKERKSKHQKDKDIDEEY